MASINETARLVKRLILGNLGGRYGENITPLVSGAHGIGKSQVVREVAHDLGGSAIVLEASMLSEGEITGLPMATKNSDGSSEVRFVPHYTIASIMRAEKEYYEKAKTTGFLNGSIGLTENDELFFIVQDEEKKEAKKVIAHQRSAIDKALIGEVNAYKFGEELDFETKMRLVEEGEVRPVVLFIDELNRTDAQTMKELMNVVLNKVVNGYQLPWWTFIVAAVNPASGDSVYATNEMDPAQLDRFLKISTTAKMDEWVDYCLNARLNPELIQAVAINEAALCGERSRKKDSEEATPSPRSWSMIANFMNTMERVNASRFFNSDEKRLLQTDFEDIVNAKVGPTTGRMVLSALKNKERMVKPSEILNGNSANVDETVMRKLNSQKSIEKKITADSVIRFLCDEFDGFQELSKKNGMKEKNKFVNFTKQINEYCASLDNATKTLFLKKIVKETTTVKKQNLFYCIASFISKDALEIIKQFKKDEDELNNN